jgi:hypothetical protein
MNSNDITNLFNQISGPAMKPMESVLSHLIGGMFLGVIIAVVIGILLKAIGVNGKTAGSIAGIVFIITVAVSLMK